MKTLIAVKSCLEDRSNGCHDTIRETWGKNVSDLYFFVGGDGFSFRHSDEIDLQCLDDYDHLPDKTRRILQWAFGRDYDYVFLCDVDTFLIPYKLFVGTDFKNYDYSGRFGSSPAIGSVFQFRDGRGIRHQNCHPWASGGFGYFLSRKAAQVVLKTESTMWAEDMVVGNTLGPKIIVGEITAANLQNFENVASWHYPAHRLGWSRQRMQIWMHDMYRDHFNDR